MFGNTPEDRVSIPGWVIPKTQNMVLDITLLNTQHNIRIKGEVKQSREWSGAPPPLHIGVVAIEKGAFKLPSTTVTNFIYIYIYIWRFLSKKLFIWPITSGVSFLTPSTPLIIPHRLPAFLESLMPLKNWCSIHARCPKSSLKYSIRFCGIFSKFKKQFYCISFF